MNEYKSCQENVNEKECNGKSSSVGGPQNINLCLRSYILVSVFYRPHRTRSRHKCTTRTEKLYAYVFYENHVFFYATTTDACIIYNKCLNVCRKIYKKYIFLN